MDRYCGRVLNAAGAQAISQTICSKMNFFLMSLKSRCAFWSRKMSRILKKSTTYVVACFHAMYFSQNQSPWSKNLRFQCWCLVFHQVRNILSLSDSIFSKHNCQSLSLFLIHSMFFQRFGFQHSCRFCFEIRISFSIFLHFPEHFGMLLYSFWIAFIAFF